MIRRQSVPLDKPTPDVAIPSAHGLEIGTDGLWSNDIFLTDTTATHVFTRGVTEFRTSYSSGTIDLDYDPAEEAFVFWRQPANISESRHTLQEAIRHTFADWPSLTLNGALGGYDGYQDYRSLWLNEFIVRNIRTATSRPSRGVSTLALACVGSTRRRPVFCRLTMPGRRRDRSRLREETVRAVGQGTRRTRYAYCQRDARKYPHPFVTQPGGGTRHGHHRTRIALRRPGVAQLGVG